MEYKPKYNIILLCLLAILLVTACASVSYLDKHQLNAPIKQLTETVYAKANGNETRMKYQELLFTKNGRVAYSYTLNANNDTVQVTEKKLWFEKQSYPDKAPYYCKTRWKPHQRERISCYTQKQYKQNEAIYYYHKNGSIAKIEDNFTNFYTKQYYYDASNSLNAISIRDKNKMLIDSILIRCKTKDKYNNCIALEQRHLLTDSLVTINRVIEYPVD